MKNDLSKLIRWFCSKLSCNDLASVGPVLQEVLGGSRKNIELKPEEERPPHGRLLVRLRIRSTGSNKGTIYWDTDISGERSAVHSAPFTFEADGEWHEVTAPFQPDGTLSRIAVGTHKDDGNPQIDWIELLQE